MATVPSNDDGRRWMTSSHTADGKDCVEITMDVIDGTQDVRDTKDRLGGALRFPRANIVAFLDAAHQGLFDLTE